MSARVGVLRTKKDGSGCSLCRASDENVGKRRCNHILEGAKMTVKKEGSTNFVNIDGKMNGQNTSFSIASTEEDLKNYISNLSNGLTKSQKASILEALRNID